MKKFAKADFQTGYGMKFLIRAFYRSITEGGPVPIPYPEILRTSRIMDEIFSQLGLTQKTVRVEPIGQGLAEHHS
jgi:hypothetical protein